MTDALLSLAAAGGALLTLFGLGRVMIRTLRKLGRLADEVLGDGDKRSGWGRRLTGIEALGKTSAERLTAIESRLSRVEAEVRPNGGASLKDQVTRIEQATGATRDDGPR